MKKFKLLRSDLAEKHLTPAEKKKREEIAMAMEREHPGMPMGKKMAIATAAAKRVAEENLDELKTSTLDSYIDKVSSGPSRGTTQTGVLKSIKAIGGTTTAIRKKIEKENKPVSEEYHGENCPHCGGEMVSEELMNEKKDACYYKVKSRYKVWPSAYASGALVKCRKKGSDSWGEGGKKNESVEEASSPAQQAAIAIAMKKAGKKPKNLKEQIDENLNQWFKEKWVRFGPDGKIRGDCARGDESEGKPKCLPQAKAHALGKEGRASAAARKRREDPNPNRSGKAINVATEAAETELGDLAHQTTLKHKFLVTYSDPNHTMASMRKEKQQKHVLAPSVDKNGNTVYQGDVAPLVKTHMKKQGYKVHDIEHVGMVSKKVYEDVLDEATYSFQPATHTPTIRNSRGHSFEGNTYNATGKKGASIYKHKDTGKYYADKISASTTFHSSAEEAAEKYHNKAK